MTEFLDDACYYDFLAETHPSLKFSCTRLDVPSFIAPLNVREPLLPGGLLRTLADAASKIAPGPLKPRSLFLGTPFERYDQSHLLDDVLSPKSLISNAVSLAKDERCEIVIVTNVDPHHPRLTEWLREGGKILPSFPDTLIDLPPGDFDTHLARLPAPNRSGIRRNIRKFNDAGHSLQPLLESSHEASALFDCYRPYFDAATVQWFPHTLSYFAELGRVDDRVHLKTARDSSGALIGFIVNFVDGQGFQSGRIGVRPDFHRKDSVYFRLLYSVVEDTLSAGGGRLSLEPTGYRMKRHLGAYSKPLVCLVIGVSPTWRMLLGGFSGLGKKMLSHLEHAPTLEENY